MGVDEIRDALWQGCVVELVGVAFLHGVPSLIGSVNAVVGWHGCYYRILIFKDFPILGSMNQLVFGAKQPVEGVLGGDGGGVH